MNKFLFAGVLVCGIASSSVVFAAPYQCVAKGGSTTVTGAVVPSLIAARSNAVSRCRSKAKKPSLCHWTSCKNLRNSR